MHVTWHTKVDFKLQSKSSWSLRQKQNCGETVGSVINLCCIPLLKFKPGWNLYCIWTKDAKIHFSSSNLGHRHPLSQSPSPRRKDFLLSFLFKLFGYHPNWEQWSKRFRTESLQISMKANRTSFLKLKPWCQARLPRLEVRGVQTLSTLQKPRKKIEIQFVCSEAESVYLVFQKSIKLE